MDRTRHYGYLLTQTYWASRRGHPWFDHLMRAYERYVDRRGNQLAASVTYYAFLSFFPLLALAFAAVGYLAEFNLQARQYLEEAVADLLPGLVQDLPLDRVARARTGAGVIGLLLLLYSGLGALAAMREALHVIWLKSVAERPNFLVAKASDTLLMAGLGTALLVSVAFTSVAQAATGWLLSLVLLEGAVAAAITRLLGVLIAVAFGTLVFLLMFWRLTGTRRPWRLLWRGALLAAVGFELLKSVGALLIRGTLDNPVYASFAVLVGLLVWMNIVARFLLFAAAWTATWSPLPPQYEAAPAGEHAVATRPAPEPWLASPRPVGGTLGRLRHSPVVPVAVGAAGGLALLYTLWARRRSRGGTGYGPAAHGQRKTQG